MVAAIAGVAMGVDDVVALNAAKLGNRI